MRSCGTARRRSDRAGDHGGPEDDAGGTGKTTHPGADCRGRGAAGTTQGTERRGERHDAGQGCRSAARHVHAVIGRDRVAPDHAVRYRPLRRRGVHARRRESGYRERRPTERLALGDRQFPCTQSRHRLGGAPRRDAEHTLAVAGHRRAAATHELRWAENAREPGAAPAALPREGQPGKSRRRALLRPGHLPSRRQRVFVEPGPGSRRHDRILVAAGRSGTTGSRNGLDASSRSVR